MEPKQPASGGAESHNADARAGGARGGPAQVGAAGGGAVSAGSDQSAGGDLIAGIAGDAQAEAERLIEEARQAAEDRLKAAEDQGSRILDEARTKAETQAKSVQAQTQSALRMENKRTSLKVREEALRGVLQGAQDKLAALIGEDGYRAVLLGWIVEAAIGLNVTEATVSVSAREQGFLHERLLQEAQARVRELTGKEVRLRIAKGDPLVGQGVVLRSADGRLEFNNQVSTRLLRYQSEIRKIVFETLDR